MALMTEAKDDNIHAEEHNPGSAQDRRTSGKTRSSWLNCALGDDKAVHWVSEGHYEAVAVITSSGR